MWKRGVMNEKERNERTKGLTKQASKAMRCWNAYIHPPSVILHIWMAIVKKIAL